jgi:uncharacterized protein (TIGR03437 family)
MRRFSFVFLSTLLACPLFGQNFDLSGNGNLTGNYLFRYVVYGVSTSTGAITEGCSVTGTMVFDGKGNYTIGSSQVYDSAGSRGSCTAPLNGTYGLQSNGIAQLDNPIFDATLYGMFSSPVLTASSTEDALYDLFVAVQAPTSGTSNAALNGAYQVGSLEYTNAQNSLARQGWFTMNANGNGTAAAFNVTGSAVNLGSTTITQNVSGTTYSFSGNGTGTLTIPGSGQGQLVSGAKVLYLSADGNYFVGGSTSGVDMLFGFKATAAGASNSLYNGTYFTAGLEGDLSQVSSNFSFLDSFYGGINANGQGTGIWHQRFNDQVDGATFDYTFAEGVTIGSDGTSKGATYTTLLGVNGQALLVMGSGSTYALDIGVKSPSITPPAGVWINPVGITNSANYTPLTNSYSPGELVNIYGNFGVPAQTASTIPVPTTLGGVQVNVNNRPAPVYAVGPNMLSVLIPFASTNDSFVTFKAVVNGATSNLVTMYTNNTSPGLYSLTQNGVGPSAILHPDFTAVTDSKPATPGETVLLFLNGLGTVNPQTADGAAGPNSPLSVVNGNVSVLVDDGVHDPLSTTITFAGLAPGFPGLYQVNFQVPKSGLTSGAAFVRVDTDEAVTEMTTISLSGFTASARSGPVIEGVGGKRPSLNSQAIGKKRNESKRGQDRGHRTGRMAVIE